MLYKVDQGVNDAAYPPKGGPVEAGLKFAMEHWPSSTDGRQSTEQSAKIPDICLPPIRQDLRQGRL